MITFHNPGEIDPRVISTMGVNVKLGNSPIGYFGTGLKMALAVLLREGQQVQIFSGTTPIGFDLRQEEIRGKPFQMIYMTVGEREAAPLGFTTELAKNWKLWMAYRELWSNAKDEGGKVLDKIPAEPAPGLTQIRVSGNAFAKVHDERYTFLLQSQPLFHNEWAEIHPSPSTAIFYQGIKVGEWESPALFTYNIKANLDLTEDRTVSGHWVAKSYVARACGHAPDQILREILVAPKDNLEHDMEFMSWHEYPDTFYKTLGELAKDRALFLNRTAMNVLREKFPEEWNPPVLSLTRVQAAMLTRALAFARTLGYDISQEIIPTDALGTGILGLARDGKIYLAKEALDQGTKRVAGTLIEEHLHITKNFRDCSREFQNYLLDRLVSLGEELRGEPV
jgi:hypothetical protein